MCPAVKTPMAKPIIKVANSNAAFGSVNVTNSNFVSTFCVFCSTTTTANNAMRPMATNFSLFIWIYLTEARPYSDTMTATNPTKDHHREVQQADAHRHSRQDFGP